MSGWINIQEENKSLFLEIVYALEVKWMPIVKTIKGKIRGTL